MGIAAPMYGTILGMHRRIGYSTEYLGKRWYLLLIHARKSVYHIGDIAIPVNTMLHEASKVNDWML